MTSLLVGGKKCVGPIWPTNQGDSRSRTLMVVAKTMSRKTVMMVVLINSKLKTFVYDLAKIVMMVEK